MTNDDKSDEIQQNQSRIRGAKIVVEDKQLSEKRWSGMFRQAIEFFGCEHLCPLLDRLRFKLRSEEWVEC